MSPTGTTRLAAVIGDPVRHSLSPTLMNAAFKASMQFYDELSAKNENWKKVYTDYARFRSDQNLWFRFTEATFDRYMQSQKL